MSSKANCRCYSPEAMIEYMRLCQKYQIHLISDEIYALTTFPTDDIPEPAPFISLLSIPKDNIIDPILCYVIHGMSKVITHTPPFLIFRTFALTAFDLGC